MKELNWQKKIINQISPMNFTRDIERIQCAFKTACEAFEEYEQIEVDEKNLCFKIKPNAMSLGYSITYGIEVAPREIYVYIFVSMKSIIGKYTLDGLNKGYYDFWLKQTDHEYLIDDIDYEKIINTLMDYALQ